MTPLLHICDVSFRYEDRQVLGGVTLALLPGTCSALIGPNGAGKTTLLRIASGALKPASGDVYLDGHPLARLQAKERSRQIALVPQQLDVPFDFTVEQIVEQGRAPYLGFLRGPTREDDRAVEWALELANVRELRNRVFNELSGGERQRVKIALGLAQQPKVLLLDEPMLNLDIGRQVELIRVFQKLLDEGLTILASIHDLHLIPDNFSTVHVLGAKQLLRSGTAEQMLTRSILEKAFHFSSDSHPLLAGSWAPRGIR